MPRSGLITANWSADSPEPVVLSSGGSSRRLRACPVAGVTSGPSSKAMTAPCGYAPSMARIGSGNITANLRTGPPHGSADGPTHLLRQARKCVQSSQEIMLSNRPERHCRHVIGLPLQAKADPASNGQWHRRCVPPPASVRGRITGMAIRALGKTIASDFAAAGSFGKSGLSMRRCPVLGRNDIMTVLRRCAVSGIHRCQPSPSAPLLWQSLEPCLRPERLSVSNASRRPTGVSSSV